MEKQEYSAGCFLLAAGCAGLYAGFLPAHQYCTLKEQLAGGVPAALALGLALRLLAAAARRPAVRLALQALLAAALPLAALAVLRQMAEVCRTQYGAGMLWLLPAVLLLLGLRPDGGTLCRAAAAVLLLGGVTAVLFFCGILPQMDWRRLCFAAPRARQVGAAALQSVPFAPELLAMAVHPPREKHWAAVPLGAAALPLLLSAAAELVFGWDEAEGVYPAAETLRAWGLGLFSRADALVVLLWLVLAFYRLLLLRAVWAEAIAPFAGREASAAERDGAPI